ncbi:MAG: N-acetylglucosamine-6-phosphate deacetylase [Pseudomonadota bacterium]
MTRICLTGVQIFDGEALHTGCAVLIESGVPRIISDPKIEPGTKCYTLRGGVVMPGFVDLQVNGGGGVMLGDAPNVHTLRQIADAHRKLGTHGMLPTLISDTPEKTRQTIEAVRAAVNTPVSGILGLHLEGPHLDPAKAGAHAPSLLRQMTDEDLAMLIAAASALPNLKLTLAPEAATAAQIRHLTAAGALVSLGHSNTDYDTAMAAFQAGARCVTHLFNAMSPLRSRAPGLVGATLQAQAAAGIIADGVHVHPATIRAALDAKRGAGEVFLVTDAMACAGSDITNFALNGRRVTRRGGTLTLVDGTLAGADLTMARAVQVMVQEVGEPLEKALQRATSIPAGLLRNPGGAGRWPGDIAGLIHLSDVFAARPLTEVLEELTPT